MSSTFLSLFDLLASRFRSDSGGENNGQGGMSVQVGDQSESSDLSGHSQPRSRSHTETVRPSNLPLPNRSPIQSRQNRSMTTQYDPSLPPPQTGNQNNNNNQNNQNTLTVPGQPPRNPNRRSTNMPRRGTVVDQNGNTTTTTTTTLQVPNGPPGLKVSPQHKRRSTVVRPPSNVNLPLNNNNINNNNNNNNSTSTTTTTTTTSTNNNNNEEIVTLTIPKDTQQQTTTTTTPTTTSPIIMTDSLVLRVPNIVVGSTNDFEAIVVNSTPNSPETMTQSNDPLVPFVPPLDLQPNSNGEHGIEMTTMGDDDNTEDDQYSYDDYDPDIPTAGEFATEEDLEMATKGDGEEEEVEEEKPMIFTHKSFFINIGKYFGSMLGMVILVSCVAVAYGLFEIYAGCRFVDNTEYSTWPFWGVVTHSISRIVLNTALCMYPYLLLTMFFGFKKTMVCLWISLGASIGASVWSTYNVVNPVLNQTVALLPSYFFFVVALLGSTSYLSRKIGSPTFRHLFLGQFVLAAIILIIYDFLLVPFYITTTSINKSVVRIVIHPGLCAAALFVSRACSSRIKPDVPGTNVFPVLIFMWFSTYYGRFFNSVMSLGFMTGTMVIVSLLELVWRTTLRPRDKRIMNAICGYCFKKELTHSNDFAKIYRDFLRHEQLYENTSILTACAIYLAFYSVFQDDLGGNYARVLSSMAIQLALEWSTDALSLYIESRVHKMEVLKIEKLPKGFYFMICYTFFLGMAYSTSRIILITEDKWL
ncbi:hypothetical protein DFA_11100 [Cavenderia fasciculata]|uniref:Transmembrane protein n=1 Tax=Cavenderia fasciculata TaxID=261658 RepID=F4QES8_CACFS|nr:uncharacterized protein DFA_11100 [Cavenderia fasciculata]EGG13339.1 hypothetical protein DFA_11100 [Cavenderia fasciculata]|eukprot:XP_004350043.1 hypothetical protein DFA_11100 [Cavenderia fasciculata]